MVNNNDLFNALKFSYIIGKIFGSVSFSINGHSQFRKIEITRIDKIISCFHISLMIAIIFLGTRHINEYFLPNIEDILTFLLLLIYIFLCITMITFGILNRSKFLNIWIRLFIFCKWLEFINTRVDYAKLKFFLSFIFLILFSIGISYSIFEYFSGETLETVIFYELCTLVSVSMESQMILVLIIVKFFTELLNMEILSKDFSKLDEKQTNIYLKNMTRKHFELFDISRSINSSYSFMIGRIFNTMFGLSYCAFILINIHSSLFLVDCILWCISNIFSTSFIIFFCESSKLEVCLTNSCSITICFNVWSSLFNFIL